jgi:ABC-type amino acid transport system permease subunit
VWIINWSRAADRRRYASPAFEERIMMNTLALLVGVVLVGLAAQAAVSRYRDGRMDLSRFWYLALGLALMIPTMAYPAALLREIQNPNPRIHTFNLPLTLAWGLGLYLVVRFAMSRPSKARVVNAA